MRFMMLVKHTEKVQGDRPVAPPQKLMDEMEKVREQAEKAGIMILNGGLAPTAVSSRVRVSGGKVSVIDGPFSETKEVIGGFAILDLKSREDAIDSARRFMELHRQHWPGWEGETEIRQIFGPEDFAPRK